jgi:hypothetical protein
VAWRLARPVNRLLIVYAGEIVFLEQARASVRSLRTGQDARARGTGWMQRWMKGGRAAFGAGKEAAGEGVMMIFPAAGPSLTAVLAVPNTLTLGSMFINFYVGFNEPSGEPIVEAGVSLSTNAQYGPRAPHPYAGAVTDGKSNTFQNKSNHQANTGLFWNVFINDALTHTASNFPASGDLRGARLTMVLDLTGGRISFQVNTMPVPAIHLPVRPKIGFAKMIAATDDATKSTFGPARMDMQSIGGKPAGPGALWRVNGSQNVATLTATDAGTGFSCKSG